MLLLCTGGNMWISADESEVISATLLPKLKKTWRAHEDLLFEAITLQVLPKPCALLLCPDCDQAHSFNSTLQTTVKAGTACCLRCECVCHFSSDIG